MATIRLPKDFKEFLRLFETHQVEYLLVGGYAVAFYGYPRSTGDMDVWIASNRLNAERVIKALIAFGFSESTLEAANFVEPKSVFRMGVPPLRIELLTSISGGDFEEAYSMRVTASIDGVKVNVIDLDRLKQNKKAAGRAKDLNDLENLP